MWNPESYSDTDFGLDPDETFEPRDDPEEEYHPAPGEPHVMTVLGPVRPDEVGVALVREHLQWAPDDSGAGVDAKLDDTAAALLDLEAFFTVSGRTVVSATPADAGRDARALVWLAQRAPVHIVGATGLAGEAWLGGATAAEMRASIARDIDTGMDGTSARPGVAVAGSGEAVTPVEAAAIEEIGAQHRRHDLPVLSLARPWRQLDMVARLSSAGVPAGRVIVAGAGAVPDRDLGRLVNDGAWLLFDGVGEDPEADQRQARRIVELVADGNVGQVLLSHGYRRRSLLTGYRGSPGFSYIVEQFAVMLLEEGLEALDVRRMLVDNVVAALTTVTAVSGAPRTHREG